MKNVRHLLALCLGSLFLTSCFQHEMTIHVKPDGSGTIVEETKLGAQVVQMMEQMAAQLGDQGENPLKEMVSEDKAKARAAKLGEGVTLEKIEEISANGSKGARATYAFQDISKIRVSMSEGSHAMPQPGQPEAKVAEEDLIQFAMSGKELTVTMPKMKGDGPKPGEQPEADPQAMEMAKQMFGDMKMSVKIKAVSGIASSNATHTEGDTVTLMEMNFGELVQDENNLKKLMSIDQQDPTKAMEALKGIKGVKFESEPKFTIKMK